MSGNNETDRSSPVSVREQSAQASQAARSDCAMQARPMSDEQALPTRVAALMRAEAAVVQGAADLIGSAERNGMGVAVLVLGEGGAVLHQLGTPLPDSAWPPTDPASVALSALTEAARHSPNHDARVAAANALLAHAERQPKLSDPEGIGAMLNGLGYPRHIQGEKLTLAGRVRHALDLAKSNGADDERIRQQANSQVGGSPVDIFAEDRLRGAVSDLLRDRKAPDALITYRGERTVVVVGTPEQIRALLDEHQFGDKIPGLRELHAAGPALTFAAERNEAVWIALESGRAIAYGTAPEIASMIKSEQQAEVAAAATAEVDAQAEVSIVAELQVKKAQPRAPSDTVRAEIYTAPFPHAFRRNDDNALCWAWMSPSRLGGTVCMVNHETGESAFITSAAMMLTEYTQLTAG